MEALELNQMVKIEGGGCVECGPAIGFGVIFGGWIGAALVALGPNCYDLFETEVCDQISSGVTGSW